MGHYSNTTRKSKRDELLERFAGDSIGQIFCSRSRFISQAVAG